MRLFAPNMWAKIKLQVPSIRYVNALQASSGIRSEGIPLSAVMSRAITADAMQYFRYGFHMEPVVEKICKNTNKKIYHKE